MNKQELMRKFAVENGGEWPNSEATHVFYADDKWDGRVCLVGYIGVCKLNDKNNEYYPVDFDFLDEGFPLHINKRSWVIWGTKQQYLDFVESEFFAGAPNDAEYFNANSGYVSTYYKRHLDGYMCFSHGCWQDAVVYLTSNMMNFLIKRPQKQEGKTTKPKKCGCVGCSNTATHTWSGHLTCDECGTPSRKQKYGSKIDVDELHSVSVEGIKSVIESDTVPSFSYVERASWNGEGLPPVGVECEYFDAINKEWESVFIVAHHMNGEEAIWSKEPDQGHLYYGCRHDFRPLKTEAEKERERLWDKANGVVWNDMEKHKHQSYGYEDAIEALIDAGWRPHE